MASFPPPMSGFTCSFKKKDGALCKRRVASGATRCWQHASTLKQKFRALTRNQALGFGLTILFGLVTLVGSSPILVSFVRWVFSPVTYVYLYPGRGLGEGSAQAPNDVTFRRVFVLEKSGPATLENVEVTLRDNSAMGQVSSDHTETYPIVGPDAVNSGASQPPHFWFAPANPGNEEYTVTLRTRERIFIERIFIWGIPLLAPPGTPSNPPPPPKVIPARGDSTLAPEMGRVALAVRVTEYDNNKTLFSCRDADFRNLPEWASDAFQPCSEHAAEIPSFEARLDPKPYVLSFPNGIFDLSPHTASVPPTHPESEPSIRRLTDWQKATLTNMLEKFSGQKVLILYDGDDTTLTYARDFRSVFQQSHWNVKGPIVGPKTTCIPVDVDFLTWKGDYGEARPHVVAVQDALKAAGVKGGHYHKCVLASPKAVVMWIGVKNPEEISDDAVPACPPEALPAVDELIRREW